MTPLFFGGPAVFLAHTFTAPVALEDILPDRLFHNVRASRYQEIGQSYVAQERRATDFESPIL